MVRSNSVGGGSSRSSQQSHKALIELLDKRSIVLVGLMGSGKTAVGRRLATRLGLSFVDADEEIEKAAGKKIKEIFEDEGESFFRDRERLVISRLLNSGPQVLATGGGAFMNVETRQSISETGVSIWLKAELPVLLRRVTKNKNRPLLKDDPEGVLRRLLQERTPVYQKADLTVESRDGPHEDVVHAIVKKLKHKLADPSKSNQAPKA